MGHVFKGFPLNGGVRQGCPLSPYLFLLVMHVLFHDVRQVTSRTMQPHRIPGAWFDEVLFADDNIGMSKSQHALTALLHTIEMESARFGLCLNIRPLFRVASFLHYFGWAQPDFG